jgi:hypothetical protein
MREIKIRIPEPSDIFPESFSTHMLRAYKEFLLAFRELIDDRIKRIEELEKEESKKEIKKIEIE